MKFWDHGSSSGQKFSYIPISSSSDAHVHMYCFSLTDRDSFTSLSSLVIVFHSHSDRITTKRRRNCSDLCWDKVIHFILLLTLTRTDLETQNQITRQEISEFSEKNQIPVYLLNNHPTGDSEEYQKVVSCFFLR